MDNFEVGDLVKVSDSKVSWRLGPIQDELKRKRAIGIISGVRFNYYRARSGGRDLIKVLWNDGSVSELNEIYLEKVDESDV
tara:strand:- start:345 stop:587 length:243 start_codon:yes stop_codon:yes gene_type:complete